MTAETSLVITGVGMRSAVGPDASNSAAAVRAQSVRTRPWPLGRSFGFEDETPFLAVFAGERAADGPWFDRCEALLWPALAEALSQARLTGSDGLMAMAPERVRVFLGVPARTRPGLDEDEMAGLLHELGQPPPESGDARVEVELGAVVEDLELRSGLPIMRGQIQLVSLDHAAGVAALTFAARLLHDGQADVCVVAGVDSLLHTPHLESLLASDRLKTPDHAFGLVPGEAGAAIVLEREERARRRGVQPLARLVAVGADREDGPLDPAAPIDGAAMTRVLHGCLAVTKPQAISRVIVDLTGERWRFLEWALVETRCLDKLAPGWKLWTPAESLGDTGAASGAVALVLAVRAFRRRYAGSGNVLAMSSSWGGERGCVVIEPP